MRTVRVAGPAPYDVVIGRGASARILDLVGDRSRRVAVVRPETLGVPPLVSDGSLPGLLDLPHPPGEAAKTVEVAAGLWERLGAAGFTRSDLVLTVGGGATTDLGGFVAATWLRGIDVVHVPTTLLAMVDAAVGGKTGINTGAGKNLVGSFHEPSGVVCDLDLLGTLPRAELVSGLAEVVKCGFVGDPEILRLVEADPEAALDPTSPVLAELVERAVAFKAEVVAADLKESDRREVLNYGHTMGHAIEAWSGYRVRHGEAVALGMVYVAELARLTDRLDGTVAARHRAVLDLVGLPTRWPADLPVAPFGDLLDRMRVDKKSRGATVRFVVLDDLATPSRLAGPSEDLLEQAFEVPAVRPVRVLNGPNLGRLGRRQPEIYGSTTYDELAELCVGWGRDLGLDVDVRQTNHEGVLLDWLNAAADEQVPVVLNAAAWTHYSYALLDACAQLSAPLVEVHISDPGARPEEFRHHSVVTAYAATVIAGHGIDGYRRALVFLSHA